MVLCWFEVRVFLPPFGSVTRWMVEVQSKPLETLLFHGPSEEAERTQNSVKLLLNIGPWVKDVGQRGGYLKNGVGK